MDAKKNREEISVEFDVGDFFNFKSMITPIIIKILYLLGLLIITIWSMGIVFGKFSGIFWFITGNQFLAGLLTLIFGNVIWRVLCETVIVLFSIHERLRSIEKTRI